MRVKVLICIISIILTGCASLPDSVKKGWLDDGIVISYKVILSSVEPDGKGKLSDIDQSYSDENITISWRNEPLMKSMQFTMKNNSSNTMVIDWNKIVFVNHTGESLKVMHTGVKFIKKEESQSATSVVKDSIISDSLVPIDRVWFKSEKTLLDEPGWKINLVLEPLTDESSLNDKVFKVLFPVNINGVITEYLFVFKVAKFTEHRK